MVAFPDGFGNGLQEQFTYPPRTRHRRALRVVTRRRRSPTPTTRRATKTTPAAGGVERDDLVAVPAPAKVIGTKACGLLKSVYCSPMYRTQGWAGPHRMLTVLKVSEGNTEIRYPPVSPVGSPGALRYAPWASV
jgi:hypothetical protein